MLLEEGGADLDEELGAAQAEGLQVGAAEKLRVEFLVLDQAAAKLLFCGVRSDFFSLFRWWGDRAWWCAAPACRRRTR